jgi:septum site-determining protein MinC
MENINSDTEKKGPAAKLKGVGDSLWVTIDTERSQEEIEADVHVVFKRLNHLATGARVVLDAENPEAHGKLLDRLEKLIREEYKAGAVSTPGPPRSENESRIRQRDLDRTWGHYRSDVLMLAGRVRSGQKITAKKHLVIMGDVNPGGEVEAGGDVIVLGHLRGTAWAGQKGDEESIIFSLDFRPMQIQIAGYVGIGALQEPGKAPEYARVEKGDIIVENYMEANPFGRIPWPKVR